MPGDAALYYVGSAGGGVWKTGDGGATWKAIFTHEPTQSIGALALAAGNPNWLWVGTGEANPRGDVLDGDGVYFTPDGGKTWVDEGLHRAGQIAAIAVDADDARTVFVCAEGNLWKRGPRRGVSMSTDGGAHWRALHANLPRGLSIWDLTFAPDHRGLLPGTHGRGIWVLDNLRPLEQYDRAVARSPFHVFTASPGVLLYTHHTNGLGPGAFLAHNARLGAVISYRLAQAIKPTAAEKSVHHGPVRIVIRDAAGTKVATLHAPGKAGIDEVAWDLSYAPAARLDPPLGKSGPHARGSGPSAVPGTYTATVHAGRYRQQVTLRVRPDPRYAVPQATYRADTAAGLAARSELSAVNRLLDHVATMRKTLEAVIGRGRSDGAWAKRNAVLIRKGKTLEKQLAGYQSALWNPHTQHLAEEDFLRHFSHLHRRVETLYDMAAGLWGEKPRAQILSMIRADRAQIQQLLTRYDGPVMREVKAWNSAAYAAGVGTLPTGMAVTLRSPPPLPGS